MPIFSLLMRYVPSSPSRHGSRHGVVFQGAYTRTRAGKMLLEYEDGKDQSEGGPAHLWGHPSRKKWPNWPNSAEFTDPEDLVITLGRFIRFSSLRRKFWYAR